jgi:hypothetical protein
MVTSRIWFTAAQKAELWERWKNGQSAAAISRALDWGRLGKLHCKAARAEVAPELLTEQNLDISLIVNHENEQGHAPFPDLFADAAARSRTIRNSVNSGLRIDLNRPAMLLDDDVVTDGQAQPVPSPAGLVVKNGLNSFSFASGGIPVPLSRIRISTLLPRFLVVAASVGS